MKNHEKTEEKVKKNQFLENFASDQIVVVNGGRREHVGQPGPDHPDHYVKVPRRTHHTHHGPYDRYNNHLQAHRRRQSHQ